MPGQLLIGVVYDLATLAIKRVIVPHDDDHLRDGRHVGLGEGLAVGLRAFGTGDDAVRTIIRTKTGREPPP